MNQLISNINETLKVIRKHTSENYSIGIILGTGLGGLVKDIDIKHQINYEDLPQEDTDLEPEVTKQVEIEVKYAGYIKREKERIAASSKQEKQVIPVDFDYDTVKSLRYEAREKLKRIRPENLGQAARISGVNPSDITILSMCLSRDVSESRTSVS